MSAGPQRTPGSMLEIYMHALANDTTERLLDDVNLGVGNYTEAEYWQQMEAFKKGMFADASMTQKIVKRAKLETQKRIVEAVFDGEDSQILRGMSPPEPGEECDCSSKSEYLDEHAEDIWENLGGLEDYTREEHQAWLVSVCTGLDMDWTPPQWRMLKARHEASRSKDAHLIDNVFGRPPEPSPAPRGGPPMEGDEF